MIRILKPRLWGRGRGAGYPSLQHRRGRPEALTPALRRRREEGGASSLEGRVAPGPAPSCLPPPLRLCPLPCLCLATPPAAEPVMVAARAAAWLCSLAAAACAPLGRTTDFKAVNIRGKLVSLESTEAR